MKTLATTGSAYKYLYHDSVNCCTYVMPEELVEKLYYNWEDFLFDMEDLKDNMGVFRRQK